MILCPRNLALLTFLPALALGSIISDVTGILLSDAVCAQIAGAVSSDTAVYYPGDPDYLEAISHWAITSTELSACAVAPGTAADVGIILQILGSTSTPFAVKGGGYASNPGFSSTTGVHISLKRFSEVTYDQASQTVVVGAGLIWDDVYAALEPFNVNVVGGRVPGLGVGGLTLGGGYSYLTNQYGLTVDTVTAFEFVRTDGQVVTVTQASDPDLFFGLKGGGNNFGIVTRFTLQTFPQGQVWGGLIRFTGSSIPNVSQAIANFDANVIDPKAAILSSYDYLFGEPGVAQLLFYDAPTPPDGIFDEFLAIPYSSMDVSTRSFLSMVQVSPANGTSNTRAIIQSGSVLSYTTDILDVVLNETMAWASRISDENGVIVSFTLQPFLPNIYAHNDQATAFPPDRSLSLRPFHIHAAWILPTSDNYFHENAKASVARISNVAVALGQTSLLGAPVVHPNYAIYDTPLADMYGDNLPALRALKVAVDPEDVMGLAGGFKF
ncbi:hypothetical protein CPB84DRAFT_1780125 [Gymnopilus junonius]|uniref:FAD-binding PCMH-type domain-containing protein n=1 Tax=Gymnopilus junonius TaxID=109634 RepID=A0A9P5NLV1_GYMJU|nr:hypothetical protein CPB84DRAFT_1780125 [Gymnopilus junonius]